MHRRRGVGVGRTSGAVGSIASSSSSSSSSSSAHASVSASSSSSSSSSAPTTSSLVQRKADEIKAFSLQNAISTLELLELKLSELAKRHQNEIKNDPIFRHRFLQMCAPLGIDVLSSSKQKTNTFHSLFGNAFGNNNSDNKDDYYYELAVKCAEVCLATQNRNGGIMSIHEIQSILQNRKTKMRVAASGTGTPSASSTLQQTTLEDIQIAIHRLSVLGGGFRTVQLPSSSDERGTGNGGTTETTATTMVISVPMELDNDHMQILSIAQLKQGSSVAGITIDQLQDATKWNNTTRIQRALDSLLQEGMAWIDIYKGVTHYWFTSIWQQQNNKS